MALRGEERREKILEVAEQLILCKGFSGTSIEEILPQAHITKGGFFYHFKDKQELATALIQRYLVNDQVFFESLLERAHELSEDSLQQMLIFLKLLAEQMSDLPGVHPGCLIASFIYQSQHFDDAVKELLRDSTLSWRELFRGQLELAALDHPMKIEVSLDELADNLSSIIEGGIVLSKVLDDQESLVRQILQYRNYIRLLFQR